MPAILTKSSPNKLALTLYSQSYAQNDVVVGSGPPDHHGATFVYGSNGMWICNIMPCGRCEWCGPSALPPCEPWQRHAELQHDEVSSVCVALLSLECVPEVLGIAQ